MNRKPCIAKKYDDMVLFTDLHLQPRNRYGGMKFWIDLGLSTIDLAHQIAVGHDNAPIVFLGDLFHYKDRHPAWLINATRERVKDSAERGINWNFLLGNHDIGSQNASIIDVFGDIPNVTVVSGPNIIEIGNTPCAFIPYMLSTAETAEWAEKFCGDATIAFLHHGLEGAVTGLGYTFPEGLSEKAIKEYEWVFCGHWHKHQVVFSNAIYLGSPYQLDFGERGDDMKGVWFLNSVEEQLEKYSVPGAPQFIQQEIDASEFEEYKPDVKGNILKVVVHATKGERAMLNIARWKSELLESQEAPLAVMVETQLKEEEKERLKVEEGKSSWENIIKAYAKQKKYSKETVGVGMDILNTVKERR